MPQYVLLLHNDGEAWKKLSRKRCRRRWKNISPGGTNPLS
jgi:hypothetical protein